MLKANRWLACVGLGLGIVVAAGLVVFFVYFMAIRGPSGKVRGAVAIAGQHFAPDVCRSRHRRGGAGAGESFFGVDLTAKARPGWGVRLVQDPALGRVVRVTTPRFPDGRLVTAAGCKQHVTRLESTGAAVNGVTGLGGDLTVDCAEVAGSLSFEGCY
jgi:hypothetical protein